MKPVNPLLARAQFNANRGTVTCASEWALKYRVMGKPFPGPWSFEHHPWLKEMHDADDDLIVGMKSAQMGFTECALNRTFYALDTLSENVLYVLPAASPDAKDFTASRFDPALEMSPHLQSLFSDVQNVGHKRAGSANLFIRGSRSRSQLKSLPAGDIVLDELAEHTPENIPLALERASGQLRKRTFMISTASLPGKDIDSYFQDSSQDHFFFKCPRCNKHIELTLDNLIITAEHESDSGIKNSYVVCGECKGRLHHQLKAQFLANGVWRPTYLNRNSRGFTINQFYSPTIEPWRIAILALRAKTDPASEQELYNSKLGLPRAVKGSRLEQFEIEQAFRDKLFQTRRKGTNIYTMGVDVGKRLHYWINEWLFDGNIATSHAICRSFGTLDHFEQLDELMHSFKINFCVVDANPERRKSIEFCKRFDSYAAACLYPNGVNARQLNYNEDEYLVSVDRTSWLDMCLSRFRTGRITTPMLDKEAMSHLMSLVRQYGRDKDGNPTAKYVTVENEDHYAHAMNYAEIALPLAVGSCGGCSITKKAL